MNAGMTRFWFIAGSIAAGAGVVLGAFGAHALKAMVGTDLLAVFETAVRYQMYHALGLLAVAWASTRWSPKWTSASGWLLLVGILVFSGSLYLMVLTGARWLGVVTPIGGVCLIAGWFALAFAAFNGQDRPSCSP